MAAATVMTPAGGGGVPAGDGSTATSAQPALGGGDGAGTAAAAGTVGEETAEAVAQEFMEMTRDKMQQFMLSWCQEKVTALPSAAYGGRALHTRF